MSISSDIISVQPLAAPVVAQAAVQPSVTSVGQRQGASNDKRQQQSSFGDRARASVAFRSFLNASTLAGLTQTIGAEAPTATFSEALRQAKRPQKLSKQQDDTTLSAEESEGLYRLAQAARNGKRGEAPSAPISNVREYQAATQRYAKSFFAVSGTFAKPGESLELTA